MELFVLLKLFAREDGFLSFGVFGGLIPRPGGSVYPPPRGPWMLPRRSAGSCDTGSCAPARPAGGPEPRQIVNPRTTDTF